MDSRFLKIFLTLMVVALPVIHAEDITHDLPNGLTPRRFFSGPVFSENLPKPRGAAINLSLAELKSRWAEVKNEIPDALAKRMDVSALTSEERVGLVKLLSLLWNVEKSSAKVQWTAIFPEVKEVRQRINTLKNAIARDGLAQLYASPDQKTSLVKFEMEIRWMGQIVAYSQKNKHVAEQIRTQISPTFSGFTFP